jgi:neutral ceramidase
MTSRPDSSVNSSAVLRAGAGRAPIELPGELFPIEGLTGVHDALHVRILLLDCGKRIALVSMEMTSLQGEQVARLQSTVADTAGLPPENVWICVTHTFSAPHFVPESKCKIAADRRRNELLWQAVEDAVRAAASQATAGLKEALLGHKSGLCDVNVNRDVPTTEGWWLGCNETGFSDKTVTVLRFEGLDGSLIALVFSHCVRSAVMERPPGADDEALVTADLAGAACAFVEREYGDAAPALFFMGAAGDQAPALAGARFQYVDKHGSAQVKDVDDRGHVIVELLGARLGVEVLRLSRETECRVCTVPLVVERADVEFSGQEMTPTTQIRARKRHVFVTGPNRLERLGIIRIGDVALVGLSPELSCSTGVSIREQSPFAVTLVLTMVNGAAKYMADLSAYDRITYEAMNSPFARGSAERLTEEVTAALLKMVGD